MKKEIEVIDTKRERVRNQLRSIRHRIKELGALYNRLAESNTDIIKRELNQAISDIIFEINFDIKENNDL